MELAPDKVGTATLFELSYHLFTDEESISGRASGMRSSHPHSGHIAVQPKPTERFQNFLLILPERGDS